MIVPTSPFVARVRVTGRAPANLAWRRYVLPELWPSWAPQIRDVEYPYVRLEPGSEGVVHTVLGVPVRFTVESVDDEQMRWSWRVRALGVPMRLEHGVEDRGPRGSATWLRVTGPPGVVQAYAAVTVLALRRLLRPET